MRKYLLQKHSSNIHYLSFLPGDQKIFLLFSLISFFPLVTKHTLHEKGPVTSLTQIKPPHSVCFGFFLNFISAQWGGRLLKENRPAAYGRLK